MESIQWSRWMSVGIERLDEDHRILIGIVNKLAVPGNREDPAVIEAILDELIDYARHHFAIEEAMMRDAGYPVLDAHRALHDAFARQVETYRQRYARERDLISGTEVFEFCAAWLAKHILREDTRFGEYAEKAAKGAVAGG